MILNPSLFVCLRWTWGVITTPFPKQLGKRPKIHPVLPQCTWSWKGTHSAKAGSQGQSYTHEKHLLTKPECSQIVRDPNIYSQKALSEMHYCVIDIGKKEDWYTKEVSLSLKMLPFTSVLGVMYCVFHNSPQFNQHLTPHNILPS